MIAGVCFLLGVSLTLLGQYEIAMWRATRRPPSKADVACLLAALSAWAEKYAVAKPTGKYLKRREADLFEACTKVGLMWIRPALPTKGHGK